MSDGTSEPPSGVPGRLDERILNALQELPGRIAFNGLRRALGAHPESLSRALRRLEREGLIERSHDGYRALHPDGAAAEPGVPELRAIARVELPPGLAPELALARLVGRWFGDLRWVGAVDRPSGRLLVWARRDGTSQVLAGISKGVLRVYVPAHESGAVDLGEVEDAAYELLAHAVSAIRPTSPSRGISVSFFGPRDPAPVGGLTEN